MMRPVNVCIPGPEDLTAAPISLGGVFLKAASCDACKKGGGVQFCGADPNNLKCSKTFQDCKNSASTLLITSAGCSYPPSSPAKPTNSTPSTAIPKTEKICADFEAVHSAIIGVLQMMKNLDTKVGEVCRVASDTIGVCTDVKNIDTRLNGLIKMLKPVKYLPYIGKVAKPMLVRWCPCLQHASFCVGIYVFLNVRSLLKSN